VNAQSNWWETFFEGPAVALWLEAISPTQTELEAERLAELVAIAQPAKLLDVPCGVGRIALALAKRGYQVTAVDWSAEFLNHARLADTNGSVSWERREMRDLPWPGQFEGAVCVGNSFGYLDDDGNAAFLRAVRAALRPGARFVLDTPMVLENLLSHLHQRPWWKVGDRHLLVDNHYDCTTGRLEIEYTFVSNGDVVVRRGSHRAYTYRELVHLIRAAGFEVQSAKPWTPEAHSLTFIATAT
jgi:2-polyprenyl-3-methyl-5-hydroxy-6-metoxy-1,4-benzoquinol methylase